MWLADPLVLRHLEKYPNLDALVHIGIFLHDPGDFLHHDPTPLKLYDRFTFRALCWRAGAYGRAGENELMTLVAQMSRRFTELRRTSREETEIKASLRALGSTGEAVMVRNLSTDGFMAETDAQFTTGSYVWIRFPQQTLLHAKVIWARGGRLGARFTAPLAQSAYRDLIGS
jgi:hypothetical protein